MWEERQGSSGRRPSRAPRVCFALVISYCDRRSNRRGERMVEVSGPEDAAAADVLVVDNSEIERRLVRLILEARGHRVVEAATGHAALDVLTQAQPMVVLLDASAGDRGEAELCARLRAESPHPIVVLAMTSSPGEDAVLRWVAAGFDDLIEKPIIPKRLVDLVEARSALLLLAHRSGSRDDSAFLRLVLDAIHDGIVVADRRGHFVLWNRAAVELLPRGPTQSSPGDWSREYSVYRPDGVTPFPNDDLPLVRALRGQSVDEVDMHLAHAGARGGRWVRTSARPLTEAHGALQGAVAIIRDVTAQRDAEREARESRAEWRALVEDAVDIIASIDRDGRIRFINRGVPPLRREEIIGSSIERFMPAEEHDRVRVLLEHVFTTGQPANIEVMGQVPGAPVAWYSLHLGPIRTDGVITGAVAVARDITQKKQTEAQLIVSDRMASVGTLAAGVAHEINNPLAAVMANLELVQQDLAEISGRIGRRDLYEMLNDARDAADRVKRIVRDLKIFSRAEEARVGPVDLRRVIESTLRMAWNEIRHRARLVKDYGEVPLVDGNESRLGQVFLNLIVNAAQAIPEGQAERNQIRITTRLEPEGMVGVAITDTGSGMSEEIRARLFTPFFTTKPIGVGTGLGLSICQRIVADAGGEIRVASELGKGSTFTVLLPPSPLELRPIAEPSLPPPATARRGRVLVIDDDPLITRAVRRTLAAHDVVATQRAQEALAKLEAGEDFDVILCDLMMPEVTGMDLHAALSRSRPELASRMVFVSGGAFTVRAREFLDTVPNLRLEKPFDPRQLRHLVAEHLR